MAHYLSLSRIEGPIFLESSEIFLLKTQLTERQDEIRKLKKQIKRLKPSFESQRYQLETQKDAKRAEIASLQNVLSPIRRIPLEILSLIFQLACISTRPRFQFELSSVCVAWRNVANDTPQIWSHLILDFDGHPERSGDVTWVKDWLSRSRGFPLVIRLKFPGEELDPHLQSRSIQVAEAIFHFHFQIQKLHLSGPYQLLLPILRRPQSSLPLLENIVLHVNSNYLDALSDVNLVLFSDAPNLRNVDIEEAFGSSSSILETLVLPIERLTSLHIQAGTADLDPAAYVEMLYRCHNLLDLSISLPLEDQGGSVGFREDVRIRLPALTSIQFSGAVRYYVDLVRCLTLPSMESLCLFWYERDSVLEVLPELRDLQERSRTCLLSLKLEFLAGMAVDSEIIRDLIATLAEFPTITTLKVCGHPYVYDLDDFLLPLTYNTSSRFLPKLTHLGLQLHHVEKKALCLTSMILSRWWPSGDDDENKQGAERDGLSRLQEVNLSGSDSFNLREIAFISGLPGLHVIV